MSCVLPRQTVCALLPRWFSRCTCCTESGCVKGNVTSLSIPCVKINFELGIQAACGVSGSRQLCTRVGPPSL